MLPVTDVLDTYVHHWNIDQNTKDMDQIRTTSTYDISDELNKDTHYT